MKSIQREQQLHLNKNLSLIKQYTISGGHKILKEHQGIQQISFTSDFTKIATISNDDLQIKIWDIKKFQCISTIYYSVTPYFFTFSPCNKFILCQFNNGIIQICNSLSGECLEKINAANPTKMKILKFSLNNKYIILPSNSQNAFQLHEFPVNKNPTTLFYHSDTVSSVAFSPDSLQIVSGSHDKTVKIWDLQTSEIIKTLKEFNYRITHVDYSLNGKYIAVADENSKVTIWHAITYQLLFHTQNYSNPFTKVQFSTDSSQIIMSGIDKTIKVWVIGSPLFSIKTYKSSKFGYIEISQDLSTLVEVSDDQKITLKNLDSNESNKIIQPQICNAYIKSVAISEIFDIFATVCDDGTIKIWKISDGSQISTIQISHYQIQFMNDGFHLISARARAIKVWNVHSGQCVHTLSFPDYFYITTFTLNSQNDQILLGGDDKIGLWKFNPFSQTKIDPEEEKYLKNVGYSERPLWVLECHGAEVDELQFCLHDKFFVLSQYTSFQIMDTLTRKRVKSFRDLNQSYEETTYYKCKILNCGSKMLVNKNYNEIEIWNLNNMKKICSRQLCVHQLKKQINNTNLIIFSIRQNKNMVMRLHSPNFQENVSKEFKYFHEFCENSNYFICTNFNYIQVYKKALV